MKLMDATIHAHGILWAIARGGGDPMQAAARAGFNPAEHVEPISSVPYETITALLDEALRMLRNPTLGIDMGEHSPPQAFGMLGYYYLSHPDARVVIEGAYEMLRRVSNVFSVRLEWNDGASRLALSPTTPDAPHLDTLMDFHCSVFTWNTRRFVNPAFTPSGVALPHAPLGPVEAYEQLFRCPVVFEAPLCEVVFDAAQLERAVATADPVLHEVLAPYAQRLLGALPGNGALAERVRAAIAMELERRPPVLENVAQRLDFRPRTLQHQLRAEGSSYQALVDDVRRQAAHELITATELPLAEISYRLGFNAPESFTRAFRRWTGRSPAAYRKEVRSASSAPSEPS